MHNTHRHPSAKRWLFTMLLLASLLVAVVGAVPASAQQLARPRPVAKRTQGAAPVFLSEDKAPDEWVEVIVQGREGANVFSLAQGSRGQVTHRLGLINAVGLRVRVSDLDELAARHEVLRIFENRRLQIDSEFPARETQGLLALYQFQEGAGSVVHDSSGIGAPLDLTVADPRHVTWLPGGGLSIDASTIIRSEDVATKLSQAIKSSNEITIEAWVKAANTGQNGPARMIVTLSEDPWLRNFTLGQEDDSYVARFRTTHTGLNGMSPELYSASDVNPAALQHIVYTREDAGVASIHVDGVVRGQTSEVLGDTSNWDDSFEFALVNELTLNRTWLGELHLVAVYERALDQSEIDANFAAGPNGTSTLDTDYPHAWSTPTTCTPRASPATA